MADTYTALLRLLLQADDANVNLWGNLWNQGVADLLEQSLAGVTQVDVTTGNQALDSENGMIDESRSMFLEATGIISATRDIVVPSLQKLYAVFNNTTGPGASVEFKTSANAGVSVAVGSSALLYVDSNSDTVLDLAPPGATVDRGGDWTTLIMEVQNFTAGDQFINTEYVVQGDHVMWRWPTFAATVSLASFDIAVQGGGNLPTELQTGALHTFRHEHPVWIIENAVQSQGFFSWPPGITGTISIEKSLPASGGLWTATSTRELVGNPVLVYFNTLPT